MLTKVEFLDTDTVLPEISGRVAFLCQPLDPGPRRPR